MRTALLQMTAGDDPGDNAATLSSAVEAASLQGADILMTPEVSNCVSLSRARQDVVLRPEAEDATLSGLREAAARHGLWVLAGSLALRADPPETRFANRSILIDATGGIVARYDKMHMFDVQLSETETYTESAGFAPGAQAEIAQTPWAMLGLSICYDLRFAYLYRVLAQAGAQVLTVPSAFSPGTGPAHWQPLLQARAIETGSWVVAPAQTGTHTATEGRARRTYGHSLVVSPWGEVVLDAGVAPGLHVVDLDMAAVADARRRLPSLSHDRAFAGPE